MVIELTNEEAQVLVNLIDIALKSAGLPAADAALHFNKKITDAVKSTPAPEAE